MPAKDGKYYVNNEIVGDSVESAVAYLKVNDKLYDYVRRQVMERDPLPLDVNRGNVKVKDFVVEIKEAKQKETKTLGDKADVKVEKQKASTADFDERQVLKAKGKHLGIPGMQLSDGWAIEKLREKVLLKEQELAAA